MFHGSRAFLTLQAWAARALMERGLPRGPARGAAHVGIELFLDGALAGRTAPRQAYARSLADAETTRVPFIWRHERSQLRWRQLVARLRTGTIPEAYRDPDFVAACLVGALASRPRLALSDREAIILRRFLPTLNARVGSDADTLADLLPAREPPQTFPSPELLPAVPSRPACSSAGRRQHGEHRSSSHMPPCGTSRE